MDKQQIRNRVWDRLEELDEARFPFPPHGRIPNFAGGSAAADRLTETVAWKEATSIKSNPDAPQRPVRQNALEAGKTLYMAVPRLREEKCFIRLDPAQIDDYDYATTLDGSSELGERILPDEISGIDLVVSGSVAVTTAGHRIGKGEGYSDLEFAILTETGIVNGTTPVVTTVHESQIVGSVPQDPHDVRMDLITTPKRTIRPRPPDKSVNIKWDILSEEKISEIPILQELQSKK